MSQSYRLKCILYDETSTEIDFFWIEGDSFVKELFTYYRTKGTHDAAKNKRIEEEQHEQATS